MNTSHTKAATTIQNLKLSEWNKSFKNELLEFPDLHIVHINRTYSLVGMFKSDGVILSNVYFGLKCYDENKNEIQSYKNLRLESSERIITNSTENIITIDDPTDYENFQFNNYFEKYLGIYIDGNISKQADYYISSNDDEPLVLIENSLILETKLPIACVERIRINVSKVMIHYRGSTYLYSGLNGKLIPKKETNYESIISGCDFGIAVDKFRFGTKFVKIIILANYGQNENASLTKFINLSIKFILILLLFQF